MSPLERGAHGCVVDCRKKYGARKDDTPLNPLSLINSIVRGDFMDRNFIRLYQATKQSLETEIYRPTDQ
jgi:hypothetical protein